MESITRNVRDINATERQALEQVVGRHLQDNQQVIIQIVALGKEPVAEEQQRIPPPSNQLPPWCNVYEGLSDEQVADLEEAILQRADLTRPSE